MVKAKKTGRPRKSEENKMVNMSIRVKYAVKKWIEEEADRRGGLPLSRTIDVLLTECMNKFNKESEEE